MKKTIVKFTDSLVRQTLKLNVNSTTSIVIFQPKMPKELSSLSKFSSKND